MASTIMQAALGGRSVEISRRAQVSCANSGSSAACWLRRSGCAREATRRRAAAAAPAAAEAESEAAPVGGAAGIGMPPALLAKPPRAPPPALELLPKPSAAAAAAAAAQQTAAPPGAGQQGGDGAARGSSGTRQPRQRQRKRLLLVVAGVLLNERGEVLLQQRPPGKSRQGMWEFPGGKVDAFESAEGALCRELSEELGIAVEPSALSPLAFTSNPARADAAHHLLMPAYLCTQWQGGQPTGAEGQPVAWVSPDELEARRLRCTKGGAEQLRMPPAAYCLLPAVVDAARRHAACASQGEGPAVAAAAASGG